MLNLSKAARTFAGSKKINLPTLIKGSLLSFVCWRSQRIEGGDDPQIKGSNASAFTRGSGLVFDVNCVFTHLAYCQIMQHKDGAMFNRSTIWRRKKKDAERFLKGVTSIERVVSHCPGLATGTVGISRGGRRSGGLTDQILLRFSGSLLTILGENGSVPYGYWLIPQKEGESYLGPLTVIKPPSDEVAALLQSLACYNPALIATAVIRLCKLSLKTRGSRSEVGELDPLERRKLGLEAELKKSGCSAKDRVKMMNKAKRYGYRQKWIDEIIAGTARKDHRCDSKSRSESSKGTAVHRVMIPGLNPISRAMVSYYRKSPRYKEVLTAIAHWLKKKGERPPTSPLAENVFIPHIENAVVHGFLTRVRAGKSRIPMNRKHWELMGREWKHQEDGKHKVLPDDDRITRFSPQVDTLSKKGF